MTMFFRSLAVLASISLVSAQEPTSKPQEPKADALKSMMKLFAENGITLDMKKASVTVDTVMGRADQPLEFLLVHRKGKDHEALLVTEAKASILNAALLAIGLEAGTNARVVQKDPLPTLEEVKAGARVVDIFAPAGRLMYMTAKWEYEEKLASGKTATKEREVSASDLIYNRVTDKAVVDDTWIFLGGKMGALYRGEEPVFIGDYQGNLVSIVYKQPQSHLVTMSHELASDEQVWWFTEICPPPGTQIKFTFHKTKPAIELARELRVKKEKAAAKAAAKAAEPAEGNKKKDADASGKGAESKK